VLLTLLYSTVVVSAFGIFQQLIGGYTSFWIYLYPPTENFVEWTGRASSFLNYPNTLAGYLNLILPFALACIICGTRKWKVLGSWTFGMGTIALFSTQSLGGLMGFGGFVVLAIFCFVRDWKRRALLLAGFCALVVGFYTAKEILNPAHEGAVFGYDQAARFLLWGVAFELFTNSPIIGAGWGNFVGLYGSYLSSFASWLPPGVYAVHNIYLQLLAETGIAGFTIFFGFFYKTIRQAFRQLRSSTDFINRALAFGVVGALLAILIHGFVDFLFQVGPQFGAAFWTLLALFVASGRLQPSNSPLKTLKVS